MMVWKAVNCENVVIMSNHFLKVKKDLVQYVVFFFILRSILCILNSNLLDIGPKIE